MSNRIDAVVRAITEGIRSALKEQGVTFDEYRLGIKYLLESSEAMELPLLIDMLFNTTIVEIQDKISKASASDLEGPYSSEDAPQVSDKIQTMEEFGGDPMVLRGKISDTNGNPVQDATLFIWSSTPDGKYSGFHDNIPIGYYRGKLLTGSDGTYEVESTVPVPYQIPNAGPTGALLNAMGRHSWRPAHVHYKVRKKGFRELTTQAYFEGGDWVGDDCCEGKLTDDFVLPKKMKDGKLIMDVNLTIEPVA